jgi:acylphosphatase
LPYTVQVLQQGESKALVASFTQHLQGQEQEYKLKPSDTTLLASLRQLTGLTTGT